MSTTARHRVEVGFCTTCGIIREDAVAASGTRIPITDCVCTARLYHRDECFYVKLSGSWLDTGGCRAHGFFPCEACDCTCEGPEPEPTLLEPKTHAPQSDGGDEADDH